MVDEPFAAGPADAMGSTSAALPAGEQMAGTSSSDAAPHVGVHRKVKQPRRAGKMESASQPSEPAELAEPTQQPGEPGEPAATDEPGGPAAAVARKPTKPKHPRPFWVEALVLLGIAMAIALVVHQFLFQAFYIPSGSMENTLHVGDRVLVNRLSYEVGHVQRGQIVVFNGLDSWTPEVTVTPPSNAAARVLHNVGSFLGFAPSGEQDFIKRVIGVPGDHVKCCDPQGRITVNDKPLDENYLYPGSNNASDPFDITVPAGRLWVEGDHRNISGDSRRHLGDPGGGTIPINRVVGRAFVIVWPFSHARGLGVPKSYSSLASAAAVGLPPGIAAVGVLPIAILRRRRRRRIRLARTT
jgi:signal peptidase I